MFLFTGDSYKSHEYSFRVAGNTIGHIIPETCRALYKVLRKKFFKCPTTTIEWKKVADGFFTKWQFPNCIGAIDGKHVILRKPYNTGSTFFNYKHSFSIVLLGLVDYDYKFIYVNIGTQGRISDGGIFAASSLHHSLENKTLNIPHDSPLPGKNDPIPYFMIGDEAFPLRSYLMKPFPNRHLTHEQRIFNYRICRARRIVENAFGILASRFRVLLKPMLLSPERAELVVLACCSLHNMLRVLYPNSINNIADIEDPVTHQVANGAWRADEQMIDPPLIRGNNATREAKLQRDYLCNYVNSPEGSVEWQDRMV
jgi:hypothetical protein